jgi:hypothetical protein
MTTLTNTKIDDFNEKLRIYNATFFNVINVADGLLNETTSIKKASSLSIPTNSASSYNIEQFATFIRKIVNFSIKNHTEAAATFNDTDLCFVTKTLEVFSSNDNNRDHIIQTLKVINVFVDILEAYKYCIDNADDATTPSGYIQDGNIDMIEIVSDKTRFYNAASVMFPSGDNRNIGYIRTVTHNTNKKVLFLSIQSFDTGMNAVNNKYNYNNLFTKIGTSYSSGNILEATAKDTISTVSPTPTVSYQYQRYSSTDDASTISTTNMTSLEARNKSLIVLLIRTLFRLGITYRKQSVSALYYYYKFVQLYSTFIIHVSNVMYNDVKNISGDTKSPFTIETYNMTTNKKTHMISAMEKRTITGTALAVSYQINTVGTPPPSIPAQFTTDTTTGGGIGSISVTNNGSDYTSTPIIGFGTLPVGAVAPTANITMGHGIDTILLGAIKGNYSATPNVTATVNNPTDEIKQATFSVTMSGTAIGGISISERGVYKSGVTPTIVISHNATAGSGSVITPADRPTITMKTTQRVGIIDVSDTGSGYTTAPTISFTPADKGADATATLTGTYAVVMGLMNRGKGYLQNPTIVLTPSSNESAYVTIVPIVYADTSITNDNNISRLEDVINEINETITSLQNELTTSKYSDAPGLAITTAVSNDTGVFKDADKCVVIKVTKPTIYTSLIKFQAKYYLVRDYIIYDKKNKYSYNIKAVNNVSSDNYQITIDAVFIKTDKVNTMEFKNSDNTLITITAAVTEASPYDISYTGIGEFLELRLKDTNTYKGNYITTRGELSDLETSINFKSSKVTHQTNLYQSQNNKKIFLERQVLAYNIILAIIVIILVAINVVKVDKEVVKTVSLSCFGAIILLFVIYFISNLTYIETFAAYSSNKLLYPLSYTARVATGSDTNYNTGKINKLKEVIVDLNTRFIGYFEKLIITLPASENYDFYKEISEIIDNDRDNKLFIKDNLDYSKYQNDNNINSIKYELENNKLYINTLLISSVIFIGLYNLYIHYITDDKYMSLLIFVCVIIFVIIVSYYYITANRRVKTVFKNIYWGPEFSKRF